jgi:hypothetical protein
MLEEDPAIDNVSQTRWNSYENGLSIKVFINKYS